MSPVFTEVYDSALKPLSNNEISVEEAYETGVKPLKSFMLKQTSTKDLDTFLRLQDMRKALLHRKMIFL